MSARTSKDTLTCDDIESAIKRVDSEIAAWNASEGPRVNWRGRNIKCISERLIAAFGSLIDLAATNMVEKRARKVVLAIDDFATTMESWAQQCTANPDETNPAGTEELWKSWRVIGLKMAEKIRATPKYIKNYIDEGLNDRQIALQYHWVDALGEPDVNKVQDERATPGTHFDAKTWVHPLDIAEDAAIDVVWQKRSVKVADSQTSNGVIPDAPESIYELLKQRVPSKQILRMKPNSTIEGIRAVAVKHELEVDGAKVYDVLSENLQLGVDSELVDDNVIRKDIENNLGAAPGILPAALYDGDDQKRGFLITAVKEMQESGKTPPEIIESMEEDFPDLTVEHLAIIQTEIANAAVAGL